MSAISTILFTLKSASLLTRVIFSGWFWHCSTRSLPKHFASFNRSRTWYHTLFLDSNCPLPVIYIPILALQRMLDRIELLNLTVFFSYLDNATQILLLVFKKPIIPLLLLRTKDKIIISFSSPLKMKVNHHISDKKLSLLGSCRRKWCKPS